MNRAITRALICCLPVYFIGCGGGAPDESASEVADEGYADADADADSDDRVAYDSEESVGAPAPVRSPALTPAVPPMRSRDLALQKQVQPSANVATGKPNQIVAQPGVAVEGDVADGVPNQPVGNEDYARIVENNFIPVADQPLSTFSIDVDTASYANTRRYL
ncbi:MAG: von Willebrand factor type A domain-containing protein, partial [Planctomycetales bacterium]